MSENTMDEERQRREEMGDVPLTVGVWGGWRLGDPLPPGIQRIVDGTVASLLAAFYVDGGER